MFFSIIYLQHKLKPTFMKKIILNRYTVFSPRSSIPIKSPRESTIFSRKDAMYRKVKNKISAYLCDSA